MTQNGQNRIFPFSPGADKEVPRPESLDEIMDLAARLSAEFPALRVDLHLKLGGILFGKMTFTPEAGLGRFSDRSWDEKLGGLLELPAAVE